MLFIPSLPISVTLSVILNVILLPHKQLGAQLQEFFRVEILLLKFMHPLLNLQYFL